MPRQMTDEHQTKQMGAALEILTQYEREGDEFLSRIVTGDESWVHYWTPETKQASMVWKKTEEEALRKFKTVPSAGKLMLTLF